MSAAAAIRAADGLGGGGGMAPSTVVLARGFCGPIIDSRPARDEMRTFVEQNQKLAPGNLKGMVLQSKSQIWFQTQMIRILPYLPGKERIIGRVTEAIHTAATAITLKDYRSYEATSPLVQG